MKGQGRGRGVVLQKDMSSNLQKGRGRAGANRGGATNLIYSSQSSSRGRLGHTAGVPLGSKRPRRSQARAQEDDDPYVYEGIVSRGPT
jgi:hypothetical protein